MNPHTGCHSFNHVGPICVRDITLPQESVIFPNFVGTTNSVGSSFGLSLSEIHLPETFERSGMLFCESLRLSSDFSSNEF